MGNSFSMFRPEYARPAAVTHDRVTLTGPTAQKTPKLYPEFGKKPRGYRSAAPKFRNVPTYRHTK